MQDFGYVQGSSTELLKTYVFSEPMMVEQPSKLGFKMPADNKTISSAAVQKPISIQERNNKKNEIFVDIIEELNVSAAVAGLPATNRVLAGDLPGQRYDSQYGD